MVTLLHTDDLSIIQDIEEDVVDEVLESIDSTVLSVWESIEKDPQGFFSSLTPDQILNLKGYFESILDLYIEHEYYEESIEIVLILDEIKKNIVN